MSLLSDKVKVPWLIYQLASHQACSVMFNTGSSSFMTQGIL